MGDDGERGSQWIKPWLRADLPDLPQVPSSGAMTSRSRLTLEGVGHLHRLTKDLQLLLSTREELAKPSKGLQTIVSLPGLRTTSLLQTCTPPRSALDDVFLPSRNLNQPAQRQAAPEDFLHYFLSPPAFLVTLLPSLKINEKAPKPFFFLSPSAPTDPYSYHFLDSQ